MFRILGGIGYSENQKKRKRKKKKEIVNIQDPFTTRHTTFWTRAQADLHCHLHMNDFGSQCCILAHKFPRAHLVVHLQHNCKVEDHLLSLCVPLLVRLFVCKDFFAPFACVFVVFIMESGRSMWGRRRCGADPNVGTLKLVVLVWVAVIRLSFRFH